MKKILLAALISTPLISFAATTTNIQFDPVKEGLPVADGGIKIVPFKKMAALGTTQVTEINSGYTYSIHWADEKAMNDLQCANMIFAKDNTAKLIELAKKIDKSLMIK